jgi:mono/diheme cytochrome c family protein
VFRLYAAVVLGSAALYVTGSAEQTAGFAAGLRRLVMAPERRALRIGLLVAIPGLVAVQGWAVGQRQVAAPVVFRSIHPAPPTEISFREPGAESGETIRLIGAESPVRALEHADPAAFEAQVRLGRDLYFGHCFYCHGADLAGDGPYADALDPRPTSFSDPGTIAILEESYVFWRIAKGGAGLPPEGAPSRSAMPAWEGVLSSEQIWQVTAFLYDRTGFEARQPGEAE